MCSCACSSIHLQWRDILLSAADDQQSEGTVLPGVGPGVGPEAGPGAGPFLSLYSPGIYGLSLPESPWLRALNSI